MDMFEKSSVTFRNKKLYGFFLFSVCGPKEAEDISRDILLYIKSGCSYHGVVR